MEPSPQVVDHVAQGPHEPQDAATAGVQRIWEYGIEVNGA